MEPGEALDALGTTSWRLEAVRLRSANKLILSALVALASATLLVRIFGLGMQVVITRQFGVGSAMDAYLVASMLPSLVANLLVNIFAGSVTPLFARMSVHRDREQASRLFSTMLNLVLILAAAFTVLILVLRNQVLFISGPGLSHGSMQTASSLVLLIFPTLLLLTGLGFLEAIFNAEGQFGWPAYSGIAVPLVTAATILLTGKSLGIASLALGTLLGLGLKGILFLARFRQARVQYQFVLDLSNPLLGSAAKMAWYILLGDSIGLMSPLIDQIFASTLSTGSVSAISYANKLIGVPVGIVFMATGRAAMPYLSRQAGIGNMTAFKATLRLYLWFVGAGTLVLSVFMFVFAHLIVKILFERGAFTAAAADQTANTLQGFVIGLVPMALGFLLAQAFSALRLNKVLMFTSIFSAVANAGFDYIFGHLFQSFGIALATSAVYCCTLVILLLALRRVSGGVSLMMPPPELAAIAQRASQALDDLPDVRGLTPEWWANQSDRVRSALLYGGCVLVAAAVGVAAAASDAKTVLKVVVGLPAMAVLVYSRYLTLIAWAGLDIFIGSAIAVFNGNNLDTALTVTGLLVMLGLPLVEVAQRMPALIFLTSFLLWMLAGIKLSPLDTVSFVKLWGVYVDGLVVAALTVALVNTRQRLLLVVDVILLVGLLVSLYGIYGYLTHHNVIYDPTTGRERVISILDWRRPSRST